MSIPYASWATTRWPYRRRRGYDQNYPDLWRYNEWKREFDGYVANGNLPSLSLVRLSHDHMGSFSTALAGVNTPETQQADDDYAVGRLIEAVAHRYCVCIVANLRHQNGPRGNSGSDLKSHCMTG
jgi:hypothetical protein